MVSYHPAEFGGHRHCDSGNVLILSYDLARPHEKRIMWHGRELLMVRHYLSKLGGYRHCDSANIFSGWGIRFQSLLLKSANIVYL